MLWATSEANEERELYVLILLGLVYKSSGAVLYTLQFVQLFFNKTPESYRSLSVRRQKHGLVFHSHSETDICVFVKCCVKKKWQIYRFD